MKEAAKPYRNQRVSRPRQRSQQHLLEVSIRASKAREQAIRRTIGIVFKLILLGGMAVGVWVGSREGVQRFFWHNPALYLSDIRVEVDPDGTLTREQILTTSAVKEGQNIFLTDLTTAKKNLDALPQIERVQVQRTLPNRIDITVMERQPIAWLVSRNDVDPTASEKALLADARGYVMKSRRLLPEYYHLPIISGVETENLVPGQKVTTFEVQSALELLRLSADSVRWQPRNIDVSKGYCLLVTDRNHAQITFGLDKVEQQVGRLYRLLDYLQASQSQQELRKVNLLVERNTPVVLADPNSPEADSEEATVPETKTKGSAGDSPKARSDTKSAAASTPKKSEPTPASKAKDKEKSSATPAKKSSTESLKKPFRM